jgi:hypothetical protein
MSETEGPRPDNPEPSGPISHEIRHAQVSARVPERVGRGAFSTGAIVLQGPNEFVLDFLVTMARPHQVAARVVLPPLVLGQMIAALRENFNMYQQKFGTPPPLPTAPPGTPQPGVEEIYEQLKLPDDMLSGMYANAVMIGHTPSEFWFDFITNFFPRSAVSTRVFLSSPQIPRLLQTLTQSFQKFQQQQQRPPGGQPPAAGPPEPRPDEPPPS